MVLFQHEGKIFQVPFRSVETVYEGFAAQCKTEHDEVVALGGLHILGTERHEARRIDINFADALAARATLVPRGSFCRSRRPCPRLRR